MELLVYKASAGSGKTFTLAVEYIRHLIANPRAYREVLAVTFTNKATAEMKERIMQQLHGIWTGNPASDVYLSCVKNKLEGHWTDEQVRRQAGTALLYLLHDYNRFRVETIDSFFQSVMRNLARELELSPNLNIELDNSEVLSTAVDNLFEKLTAQSPVLAWMMDYISEKIDDNKRWDVTEEIKNFGRNIFDESYIENGAALREKLRNLQLVKLYRETLREMRREAMQQMAEAADKFDKALGNAGLTVDDLSRKSKGIYSYFNKLRHGTITDDVLNITVVDHMKDVEKWATKTAPNRSQVIDAAQTSLQRILLDTEILRPQCNFTVNSCNFSLQHLNQLQLLNHIDEEVRLTNQEHNRFLLSDTTALLHRLIGEGDSSFVFEKLGAQLCNVMIDEFQDTSRMQWDNFRLLLLEGLSQGADSLIVGDVKQSIYRWRNGDWRILSGLRKTLGGFPIRVETLKINRRSEAHIIGFNNAIFQAAVGCLNDKYREDMGEDCTALLDAYADVAQESPKEEVRGAVKVSFLEPNDEENYQDVTLAALAQEVKSLLEQGVRMSDIAILVRKNKMIPIIAGYFDKECGIAIVSDEAFRLDASSAVNTLIDALRYLNNTADEVSLYLLSHRNGQELPANFVQRVAELRLMPLHELLEELYRIFDLQNIENQSAYLFAFFDAVTEYLQNNSSQLNLFIRYWDETLCQKTIQSNALDGIRILSIHKSKGLEYHTVLIPFCDWKMENETNNQLVWCHTDKAPYNTLDLIPVNYCAGMTQSVFRGDYLRERLQLWVDNLNLLYVALTRAGKNLMLWTKKGQTGTMSELLANALPKLVEQRLGAYVEGSDETIYQLGEVMSSPAAKVAADRQTGIQVEMQSLVHEVEFKQSNRSADFIAGVSEEESGHRFINRGRLLHTLFSNIDTLDSIEGAISNLVFEGVIGDRRQEEEIRQLVERAFATPEVQDWYSGSWRLFNECDIIWRENGQLCTRRPDRVMMRGNDLVVLDFKFGKPKKSYVAQVKQYMQLLRQMGHEGMNISGYLWYIGEENKVVRI